nr:unnamed protein product [Spirometra erinaceieuropaei]
MCLYRGRFPRRFRSPGRLPSFSPSRPDDNLTVRGIPSSDASCQLSVLDPEPENPFRQLLTKYPAFTLANFNASIPPHDVGHHIRTIDPPCFLAPSRLGPARLAAAKSEFEHMLQMDIIRQSESPWASPLHMAATGDWRPLRLFNASQTFNGFVDSVRYGLPFVYAYIDDLLVVNSTAEDYTEHLATVFNCLQQLGVVLNPSKCVLSVPSLEFLGHLVDSHGIRPLPSKVAAIRDFALSTSKRQLQRLLGMVNCYRRLLANCSNTILPLTSLLSGSKRTFELTPAAALTLFGQVKALLADATLLTHFL